MKEFMNTGMSQLFFTFFSEICSFWIWATDKTKWWNRSYYQTILSLKFHCIRNQWLIRIRWQTRVTFCKFIFFKYSHWSPVYEVKWTLMMLDWTSWFDWTHWGRMLESFEWVGLSHVADNKTPFHENIF